MLPSLFRVAAKNCSLNVLGSVQLAQRGGEQQRGVVHQGSLRLVQRYQINLVIVVFVEFSCSSLSETKGNLGTKEKQITQS